MAVMAKYAGLPDDAVMEYAGLPPDALPGPKPFNPSPLPTGSDVVDGVPKWGRDNPNTYAGVMTALDLLPMVAAGFKTTGIGIPVAGAINAGAKALQRNIADQSTTGADVALDFAKGAAIEGGGRAVSGAVKAVTNIPAVRETGNRVANWLTRSAGKFGTGGGLTPTEQKAMAETVLNKGYKFNEGSWQDMLNTIKGNTGKVDDIYAAGTQAGDTFTAPEVLANGDFGRLLNRGENVRGVYSGHHGGSYTDEVNSVLNRFRQGAAGEPAKTIESAVLGADGRPAMTTTIPAVPTPYTPTALNVAKRQLYQDIGTSYKNRAVNAPSEAAQKTLAGAIKDTLDTKYPNAVPFNLDSSELLQLEPYFARAINRISQRDVVGLGEKIALGSLKDPISLADVSPSTLGKLVAAVWDRPEIKSRVAQMMYSRNPGTSKAGVKIAGQMTGPALRTALEAAMYTSDPLGIR
jgi:hypothetical protein